MTTRLKIAGNSHPYPDDPSYLDAELAWLKVRVSRICAERKALEAQAEEEHEPDRLTRPGRVGSRDARLDAVALRLEEDRQRLWIDSRLDRNRQERGAHTLGLDVICKEHGLGLSSDERLILLVCLPLAISQRVAEMTLGELCHHWGSIAVSDAIAVLDPQDIGSWINARRYLRPHAPLVQHGLIEVSRHSGEPGPDTLPSADVRLTLTAFARICGDPEALTEGD